MRLQAQQAEFEDLKQSAWARTDDDDVGMDCVSLEFKR
jgi:hypothetical protein